MEPRTHERVWETTAAPKPWKPMATYGLLGAIVAVFLLQNVMAGRSIALHNTVWTIAADWASRPWSPITSTFAHGGPGHLFWNGLMLFFFGPNLERILGRKAFVAWFLVAGAVSGILQAELSAAWGSGLPALGASGALMFLFGALMTLFPNNQLLIYGIIPLKFWIAGILFAAMDIFGTFNPGNGIGNFAHLAGMFIGIGLGLGLRHGEKQRGRMRGVSFVMR